MNWFVVVATAIAGVGGLAGLGSLATVGATRRKLRAEADEVAAQSVRTIIGGATDSVKVLRETLSDAENRTDALSRDLTAARQETTELRREVARARSEAEQATAAWRRLRLAILDPQATIEALRAMVEGGLNGH